MRILVFLTALIAFLAACQSTPSEPAPTPMPCPTAIPTPTLIPYWDLREGRESLGQPEGDWQTITLEEEGIAFQMPIVFDQGACFEFFVIEKQVRDVEYTLIGYGGSSIRISIYTVWDESLEALALNGQLPPDMSLLTAVEPFTLGGFPGYRYISWGRAEPPIAYYKVIVAMVADRLVMVTYLHTVEVSNCNAPPLSSEAIFEHMVETIEFIP
jgi:hypothetical protein